MKKNLIKLSTTLVLGILIFLTPLLAAHFLSVNVEGFPLCIDFIATIIISIIYFNHGWSDRI